MSKAKKVVDKVLRKEAEIAERERSNFEKYTITSIDDLRERAYKNDDAWESVYERLKDYDDNFKKIQQFANDVKEGDDDNAAILDSLCEKVETFNVGSQVLRHDYVGQRPVTLEEEINTLRSRLDTAFSRIRDLESGLAFAGWRKVKYTQHVDRWERKGFWARLFERE